MPSHKVVAAADLSQAMDRMIAWAKDVNEVLGLIDPNIPIRTRSATSTRSSTTYMREGEIKNPIPLAMNCPPPFTGSTSSTTTPSDLHTAMKRIIAMAEDVQDIVSLLPKTQEIRVPEKTIARGKRRKEALREKKTPDMLLVVNCPPPVTGSPKRRLSSKGSVTSRKSTRKSPGR
jgi:hypothetical protein